MIPDGGENFINGAQILVSVAVGGDHPIWEKETPTPVSAIRRVESHFSPLFDSEAVLPNREFLRRDSRPYFPPYGSDPKKEERIVVKVNRWTQTIPSDFPEKKKKKSVPKSKVDILNGLQGSGPPIQSTAGTSVSKRRKLQNSHFTDPTNPSGSTFVFPTYQPVNVLPQRMGLAPCGSVPSEYRRPQKRKQSKSEVEKEKEKEKPIVDAESSLRKVAFEDRRPGSANSTCSSKSSTSSSRPECARHMQFRGFRKSRNWFSFLSHPQRSEFGRQTNGGEGVKTMDEIAKERQNIKAIKQMSYAAQYQWLRRNPVSIRLGKSKIHGVGVFSNDDIAVGQFIAEYKGELVRNNLVQRREEYYRSKGLGSYMFQMDLSLTVDGTMKGGMARFVNHSCDPNCSAKVIRCEKKKKHIMLIAAKKISKGDELSYDYKMPKERDKIPCLCGSLLCRNFLN